MNYKIKSIGLGNWPIANCFHDQTISMADCENLTISHWINEIRNWEVLAPAKRVPGLSDLFSPGLFVPGTFPGLPE